jgi:3-methyladenine DNA glycosylase AlkD
MTLQEAIAQLKSAANPAVYQQNKKRGAPDNQIGVILGDIRKIAKTIKADHELGLKLWDTGIVDAQLLGTLIIKPKLLSEEQLERMVASVTWAQVADWLTTNVVKQHPAKEALRQRWMHSDDPWLGRAAWSLTTERVSKDPNGLNLSALLDRIDKEMGDAPEPTKWTMNYCLWTLGVDFAEHRERAIEIGERIGAYRDFPCSKGCVSPFAPIAIREIVARAAKV